MMWKLQQAMQDNAIHTTRIYPAVHPGNRDVHMAEFPARLPRSRLEKPRTRELSQPALSYEHIENFTKDLEVRRDLGNRTSPVNRAHIKKALSVIQYEGS